MMDRGELLRAFVEGNGKRGAVNSDRTEIMLQGLMGKRHHSDASFLLGPLYWGYRKCLLESLPIVILFAVIAVSFSLLGVAVGSFFMYFVPAFTFFSAYRTRAKRIIRRALNMDFATEEEVLDYVRRHGGTSVFEAILVAVLLASIVVIAALPLVGA